MYLVTKEDFETVVSKENLDFYSKLDDLQKEKYLEMYSMYNSLLMQYIRKHWGIKRYDEQMLDSDNNFTKVKDDDMDIYQLCSKGYFNYYYLRNNIYVQRLTEEEKSYLSNKYNNKNFLMDSDDELFIKNTLDKVIFENVNLISNYMYGPNESLYLKPSNSIVIGIRYDNSIHPNQLEEDWNDLYYKQTSELYFFTKALENELNRKLQYPVSVIEYNNFNIKMKVKNTNQKVK